MYLKSIEVHGFKSFANKINFKFHNGITGIVGPNGSGKSNVADAVRWVLGEQRAKQLRGASMQDVIFSGTEARKSLSYAYVAITLDNTTHQLPVDYEEVTVARRIYRSGESEYLMNGTPCRLKDVNELFYDTGIGKEGYSIIGQGQIDKILSGKPEERRELFDEAAGIVKFKRRKDASQKKLEEEKQNLLRVKDILSEQERQISPLEEQAEIAKVYLKYKEELKKIDVNMFLLEHNRIIQDKKKIDGDYKVSIEELEEIQKQYEQIKVEYNVVQSEIEKLEESIELSREKVTDTSILRGKLEGQINVLKEKINSAKSSQTHFLHRKESVEGEIKIKQEEKQKIVLTKQEIDHKVNENLQISSKLKSQLEFIQHKFEECNLAIEDSKNSIMDELNQRAIVKSKLSRFDSMLEQTEIRKSEVNSKLVEVKIQEISQEEVRKNYEEELETVTNDIQLLNLAVDEKEKDVEKIRGLLIKEDKILQANQELYHKEQSKYDALSNLSERYEGYGNSVKKVMEQKSKEAGIIGVIADIIKVDKKFEIAIEIALGGNIQNIVTDTEKTAQEMIRYLKENKFGRATFLPLTSVKNPQEFKMKDILKEKGVLGLANELVNISPEYKNLAKSMLGRVVVVETLEEAVAIAKKYNYSVRMVTLDGELLVPGGALSGGAYKHNSNLLSRGRELEELEKNIQKIAKEMLLLEENIQKIKEERNAVRIILEKSKAKIQSKFIEQNTARINIQQIEDKMKENEGDVTSLQVEVEQLEKKLLELQQDKINSIKELEQSENIEKEIELKVAKYQNELEIIRKEEGLQVQKVSQSDLAVEKMLQTQEFQQQNLMRIEQEILGFNKELKEILESITNNTNEQELKGKSILELESNIQDSESIKTDSEKKLKEEQEKKELFADKQKGFIRTNEEMSNQIRILDKEVNRLKMQSEKLDEAMETQINYMWEEYEMSLSHAMAIRDEQMVDLENMKKEAIALKDNIKKLGDVNVNAIEDFKQLMERYSFLKTQHDDLVEAEVTLIKLIEELDSSMRKQFNAKFSEIKREFDIVFKELFGGGKGTLELIENEDILEAGIRIIAQPPGKKLQNMMQLSGGEKALTAIALLFAIQNLKPSPFCLLDEIEAALDESNVGRFAKYLHKLAKNTQFIVITHRRGTMDQCDRLYGITMQEKGISALVSVNLVESNLDE